MSVYDVNSQELIEKAAIELKKVEAIKAPSWATFVKTGVSKERPPIRLDWWHVRAASVLRKIYRYGPMGVSKLRVKYGSKKNRGHKTEHFYPGSGNIVRKVLQQLEKAGFVKQADINGHKGRVITAQGKKFLDSVASQLSKKEIKEVKAEVDPVVSSSPKKQTKEVKAEAQI